MNSLHSSFFQRGFYNMMLIHHLLLDCFPFGPSGPNGQTAGPYLPSNKTCLRKNHWLHEFQANASAFQMFKVWQHTQAHDAEAARTAKKTWIRDIEPAISPFGTSNLLNATLKSTRELHATYLSTSIHAAPAANPTKSRVRTVVKWLHCHHAVLLSSHFPAALARVGLASQIHVREIQRSPPPQDQEHLGVGALHRYL